MPVLSDDRRQDGSHPVTTAISVLPPLLLRMRKGSFLARLKVPVGLSGAGQRRSCLYIYCPFIVCDLEHWAALVGKEKDCNLVSAW